MVRRKSVRRSRDQYRDWHRLFGLLLMSHLEGSRFEVETERDLSRVQQFLDVVVIRRDAGEPPWPLPDGLDDFVEYNLLTFKSFWETLDEWTLKELSAHYVSLRKEISPKKELLAETQFRLYAVCVRTPRELFKQIPVKELGAGVYDCKLGSKATRIVVAGELPLTKKNALLHLFSAARDRIQFGQEHYQLRSDKGSTIVGQLFENYKKEGLRMPYTMDDLYKEIALKNLGRLTPKQRLHGLKPEVRLAGLKPQERLEGLKPEERLAGLKPQERLEGLKPEERLQGLSPSQIKAYLRNLQKNSPTSPSKKTKPKK